MAENKTPVEKTTTSATPKTTKSTATKAVSPKTNTATTAKAPATTATATKATASKTTATSQTTATTTAPKTATSAPSAKATPVTKTASSTSAPASTAKSATTAPKTDAKTPTTPKAMPSAVAPKTPKATSSATGTQTANTTATVKDTAPKTTATSQTTATPKASTQPQATSTPKTAEPASVHMSAGNPDVEDVKVGGIMVDQDVLSKSHMKRSERRKKTVITILIALIIASWVGIAFIVLNYLNAVKPAKGKVFIRWDGEYYDNNMTTPMQIYQDNGKGELVEIPDSWEMPKNIQSGSIYHLNLYIKNISTTENIAFRVKLTITFNGIGENGTVDGNAGILYAVRKEDDDGSGYYEWEDGYLVYKNDTTANALTPDAQVKLCGDLSLNNDIKDINCDNLFITITIEAYPAPHSWDV